MISFGSTPFPVSRRRVMQLASAAALSLFLTVPSYAQLSEPVQKQIAEIYAFKKTFTPAEKKMSSNLVMLSREARRMPLGNLAKFVDRGALQSQGKVLVEIGADVTPALLNSDVVRSIVADNDNKVPLDAYTHKRLKYKVKPDQLLELAKQPNVKFLNDGDRATTNVGSVTTQGYVTHGANKVIGMGYNGTGVTVGVLSDSATAAQVSALVASGDLPNNVQIVVNQGGTSQAGTGAGEGAAMMEIVHDVAPGANLVFATGNGGQANFAANIRLMRFTYHCDIIVDDLSYYAEGVFQDDVVAKAVNDVTADGAIYFSSAANSGNLTLGTSGTWEGDFVSGGAVSGVITGSPYSETGTYHMFAANQNYDVINSIGSGVTLKWSDPLAGSTNDYDLFILNSTGTTVKGYSAGAQSGTQNPYEGVLAGSNCGTSTASGYCGAAGDQVVVVLYSGVAKAIHVDSLRGTLSVNTTGSTYGHNAGKNTVTMAATYWNSGRNGTTLFKGGASNPIETFSSDGPRRIFFNPDGTEITPGNDLFAGGGTTLQKPDATAADGVSTHSPGFLPFYGTSAAAPHAAGIAALVKSANPALTGAQIRSILTSTALDIMSQGVDRDSGYGILMAVPAVQAARAAAVSPASAN